MAEKRPLFAKRGIFIKMFAWFWLVMAVVISIIFALDRLTEITGRETPLNHAMETPLAFYGPMAIERLEGGDEEGFREILKRLRVETGMRAYLFSPEGRRIGAGGHGAPPEVELLADKARETGKPAVSFSHARILAAIHLSGAKGTPYVIVGRIPNRKPVSRWGAAAFWLPRLGIALIISLVACYLLARYLTVTIIKLSEASRRLASGDLTIRVSPAAEKRRDEIGELARDFDLMAEKLELLLASQRRLLGDISHELRSPLARLNVALELARRSSSPEAGKSLDRIEWEAERLNDLIGELLTLTRLEGNVEIAAREEIDLKDLVREIAGDADFEAQSQGRSVRVTAGEKCTVTGVRQLLRSAIENVVRNAVSYTAEGTEVEIDLACLRDGNSHRAVVRVRDHGPGVPPDALPHLFRPFYRVDEARERLTGGTGLGLAITEKAVLIHGGTVRAENAPDGGLVVEIGMPCSPSPKPAG